MPSTAFVPAAAMQLYVTFNNHSSRTTSKPWKSPWHCITVSCIAQKQKKVTTTQFPRRLIKEKAEVRQSQGSVPPFPHRGNTQ
jgi:hypothetical protein